LSHGVTELSGYVIYQSEVGQIHYLTPLSRLLGFDIWQERNVEGIIVTFEMAPGVRTIANLWDNQDEIGRMILSTELSSEPERDLLYQTSPLLLGCEN